MMTLTHLPSPRQALFRVYWALWKHKWWIPITFAVGMLGTLAVTYLIDPAYKATVKILVRHNPQNEPLLFRDIQMPVQVSLQINPAYNLVEFSTSRGMAEEVALAFNMNRPKELKTPRDYIKYYAKETLKSPKHAAVWLGILQPEVKNYLADAINELQDDIEDIQVQRDTEIIDLSIWAGDPVLSAKIANMMADRLVEKTRDITKLQIEEAYKFTSQQLAMAESGLSSADKALLEFKQQHDVASLADEQQLLLRRLDQLQLSRAQTDADLRQAEAEATSVAGQLASEDPTILASSVVGVNPVATDARSLLVGLEQQLASRSVSLGDRNPEVAQMRAQIASVSDQIKREERMHLQSETTIPNPIRQDLLGKRAGLSTTLPGLQAKQNSWAGELKTLEARNRELTAIRPVLEQLERDRSAHSERLNTLKSKLIQMEVMRNDFASDFEIRVVDRAVPMENVDPDWPDWDMVIYISPGIALLVALCVPLLLEYLNDGLEFAVDAEQALGVPVLGVVPATGALSRRFLRAPRRS